MFPKSDYNELYIFRCRQFYYGGCGGNENNFVSERECENACMEPEEPITLPPTVPSTQPPTQPPTLIQTTTPGTLPGNKFIYDISLVLHKCSTILIFICYLFFRVLPLGHRPRSMH